MRFQRSGGRVVVDWRSSLEGFGFEEGDIEICAAGAIIEYLNETQKTALGHILSLKKIQPNTCLEIDQLFGQFRSSVQLRYELDIELSKSAAKRLHPRDRRLAGR